MTRSTEQKIIEQAARGDKAAAEKLIKAHQASLYAYLLRLCGRPEFAEDICQDAFVRVLTNLDRSKLNEHPVTWISPDSSGDPDPFMLYYGDGPVYAIVTGREPSESGDLRLFHTADRAVVEHLAFQVKRDLGIPLGA